MIMNKYELHVFVVPEDRADEQLAVGFTLHDQVNVARIQVMPHVRGWSEVLKTFQDEYIERLRKYPKGHVVMLIDFDGSYDERRAKFEQAIPDDVKQRVFVIGPKRTPEILRNELGNKSFEQIGISLADDCYSDTETVWGHEQLKHNDPDRQRLVQAIKPFLF